jgi:ethanolamine transporter
LTARLGTKLGLEAAGASGILATLANIIAIFRLVRDMRPRDKVLNIGWLHPRAQSLRDNASPAGLVE